MKTSQWRRAVKNRCVFSARLKTLSDRSCDRSAGGRQFHVACPLTAKLRCPVAVRARGTSRVPVGILILTLTPTVTLTLTLWRLFAIVDLRYVEQVRFYRNSVGLSVAWDVSIPYSDDWTFRQYIVPSNSGSLYWNFGKKFESALGDRAS